MRRYEDKTCTNAAAALLAICLIASCCDQCQAQYRTYGQYYQPYYQQPTVNRLDRRVDGSTNYNVGRSAEAPTSEADKLFMVLITSDAYQQNKRERDLVSWLNYDPRLAKLRSSTRFNWYTKSSPHYRDRLRFKLGEALPIVGIYKPDGEVLLNVTAISMPHSSGELADMCDDAVNARFSPPSVSGSGTQIVTDRGRYVANADCPNCPDDQPQPGPDFDDGSRVEPIDEVVPPKRTDATLLYLAVGLFGTAAFGILVVGVLMMPRGSSNQLY